jgi:hypothetical protein
MGLINWLRTGKWDAPLPPASLRSGPAYIKAEPEPELLLTTPAGKEAEVAPAEVAPAEVAPAEVAPVRIPWRNELPPFIPAEATTLVTRTAYRTGYTDSQHYFEVRYNKEARRNPFQVFKIQNRGTQRDYSLGFGSYEKAYNYARHAAEALDWDVEPETTNNEGYKPNEPKPV